MKKNGFYLFAMMMAVVLCVGFTSCDDEDSGYGPLIGTWHHVADAKYKGGTSNTEYYEYDEVEKGSYRQFKPNGKGARYTYNETTGKWEKESFTYEYNQPGQIIILNNNTWAIPLRSLTETEMRTVGGGSVDYFVGEIYRKVDDSVLDKLNLE